MSVFSLAGTHSTLTPSGTGNVERCSRSLTCGRAPRVRCQAVLLELDLRARAACQALCAREEARGVTHLVYQRRAKLGGRDLGVGVGPQAEDTQLHALDRAPHAGLRALHGQVGQAARDVDEHGARQNAALLDVALVAARKEPGHLRDAIRGARDDASCLVRLALYKCGCG